MCQGPARSDTAPSDNAPLGKGILEMKYAEIYIRNAQMQMSYPFSTDELGNIHSSFEMLCVCSRPILA